MLKIKLLNKSAKVPVRQSAGDAGYDLFANEDILIPQGFGNQTLVETGIAIGLPSPQTYGRIAPRSGLSLRHGLCVGAGVIDYSYSGEIKVLLFNFGAKDYRVKVGDRIAQLIVENISAPPLSVVDDLEETERGAKGFGASGV